MSRVSVNPNGLADYVLELDEGELNALMDTARSADPSVDGVEQARTLLASGLSPAGPDALADYVLELDEGELNALMDTTRAADGRKSEVKQARDTLGLD